jgi:hypothetical protein
MSVTRLDYPQHRIGCLQKVTFAPTLARALRLKALTEASIEDNLNSISSLAELYVLHSKS